MLFINVPHYYSHTTLPPSRLPPPPLLAQVLAREPLEEQPQLAQEVVEAEEEAGAR